MRPAGASGHCGLLTLGAWGKSPSGWELCLTKKRSLYMKQPIFWGFKSAPAFFWYSQKYPRRSIRKNSWIIWIAFVWCACGTRLKTFQEPGTELGKLLSATDQMPSVSKCQKTPHSSAPRLPFLRERSRISKHPIFFGGRWYVSFREG